MTKEIEYLIEFALKGIHDKELHVTNIDIKYVNKVPSCDY